MHTSTLGLDALKQRENCKLIAYRDTAGIWTIGFGQTGPNIVQGVRWTRPEAEEALRLALIAREAVINTLVKVPLTQNQFDALISFLYNIGTYAFKTSTLLRKLNLGLYDAIPGEIHKWDKQTNPRTKELEVCPGLVNRRTGEAVQFATPDPT